MTRAGKKPISAARVRLIPLAFAAALMTGCGAFAPTIDQNIEAYSAEEIYDRGEFELARGRPDDAAKFFGEIERLYPYSAWGKRALIMQAFAYHKAQDYPSSRGAAQRFLDFYPADSDAAYAQYLLALSYYDQIDEVGRDQGLTMKALEELRKVIEVYPDSEYADSAVLKFDLAFNHLAAKEMEVGRYYLKRRNYAAAASRFRIVVEKFQTTSHTPEALYRLVEAYLGLGLTGEAQTAGAILGHNFRGTEWYQDAYALLSGQGLSTSVVSGNWLSQVYRQMVRGEWL